MWQRQSIFSISSVDSANTANDTLASASASEAPTDAPLTTTTNPTTPNPRRPGVFRNSTIDNADQDNSLRDRIRYLTSSSHRNSASLESMASPFGSPHTQHTPNLNRQQVYTPRRSRSRATSLANSVDHRLSIIDEDNPSGPHQPDPLPPRPVKASHRPLHRVFGIGEPPKYVGGASPPDYSIWDETSKRGEKLQKIRNNRFIAGRGGLGRICLIILIILTIVLALAIGLGVGLSKRKSKR